MIAKYTISFLFLVGSTQGMHTSAFATTLFLKHTREKQEKIPLFIQAEQHEKDFMKNLTECSNNNNCDIHEDYQQARHNVLCSIQQLVTHSENLKQNTSNICHANEKIEAKDIKNRLLDLLMNNQ